MTSEEKKKLNDELLRWAGFEPAPGCKKGCHVIAPPPSYKVIETPNFPDSFDDCREWLEPMVGAWEIAYKYYFSGMMYVAKVIAKQGIVREVSRTESPSLAFCLAVKKLKDAKKD